MLSNMLLTDGIYISCSVKLEFDINIIYSKCDSNTVCPIVYSHEPLIIRIFPITIGLVECMNIFAFRLEVVKTFAVVTCLAQAGHLSLCFSCLYPQNLQLNFNFSLPSCEVLFIWEPFLRPGVLVLEFLVILFTLVKELGRVALSLNSLTCLFDCSKALQIFTALESVKLSSLRSNSNS